MADRTGDKDAGTIGRLATATEDKRGMVIGEWRLLTLESVHACLEIQAYLAQDSRIEQLAVRMAANDVDYVDPELLLDRLIGNFRLT